MTGRRRGGVNDVVRIAKVGVVFILALGISAAAAPRFDSSRAWEDLRQLVAIGPRPAGSPAIVQTRAYIRSQLKAAGVSVTDQTWDEPSTPIGRVRMVNLIATFPGARKDRLVIAGHYDTKLFHQFRFVGADDGGSSAAFLLELARALKGRKNPLTIQLVFLDGEEAFNPEWRDPDNTYGSRHYVDAAQRDGSLATLKAFVLVDMVADRDLRIRRDANSTPWLTDAIWAAAKQLKYDSYFLAESTTVIDDHIPFLKAGVPSVDIIDLEYEPWHTQGDTLEAVSARSLQIVGDTLVAALPGIERHLSKAATER